MKLFTIAAAIGVFFIGVSAPSAASAQGIDEVVLWPAVSATLHGNWIATPDSGAAGGARVQNPNASLPKTTAASSPRDYFELTFNADAHKPYRLWMRARAESNAWSNDSVYVQFSGSVTQAGTPTFRIGTTSATTYTIEDCTSCGVSGWGWQDNGFGAGVLGPAIYFERTGPQTIRIQRREDGIAIDQVVLSAERYLKISPGALTRDSIILEAGSTMDDSTPVSLPSGWRSTDIGATGQRGFASESGGTFTVSGAGSDVWGAADAFHYAYRTLTGDGTITAEVVSIEGAMAWTKMGVMIRATVAANSPHAFMLVSTAKGVAFQRRRATGGVSTNTSRAGTAPRWVRLKRAGAVITASVSADGRTWSVVGSDTFSGMPATVLVGLAASSHDATRLATGTFADVSVITAVSEQPNTADPIVPASSTLQVSPNDRFLRDRNTGKPVFYFADTAWGIFRRLSRADVNLYLDDCVAKGFNAIQGVALWRMSSSGNAHGDAPIGMTNGKYDPAKIITTPGDDPADPVAYDYWDHMDYIIDQAAAKGLYVGLEPTWGNYVSGTTTYAFDMSSNIFTVQNARAYGEFLGRRYSNRPNIIWMLGGDRSAIYPNGDFRAVWRSMAEGIGRGVTGEPLVWNQAHPAWNELVMTYHSQRRDDPGSSIWFHDDAWLSFNSTQIEYNEILRNVQMDWSAQPTKPILVIEGRYEDATSTDNIKFVGAFKQRYQLYHSFLAGSLGFAYGHTRIWDFAKTDKTWKAALNDPGRLAMNTFWRLLAGFSDTQLLNRVPDQTLLDGALGSGTTEDLLVAMRDTGRKYALVYSTNGRDIRLNAAKLAAGTADAYWFSPRTGKVHNSAGTATSGAFSTFPTGSGTPIKVFNPPGTPGADNDWILKVVVR